MANFEAFVDYEDPYVQPLILEAFENVLPRGSYDLIDRATFDHMLDDDSNTPPTPLLPYTPYETLPFTHALAHPHRTLLPAYIIRKSLIRKHYLSHTIAHHVAKNPLSPLAAHFKPAVAFELDYAEFLDDALMEAESYEMVESLKGNGREGGEKEGREREYWILKPGMSDRGQGIRLFSTMAELQAIFDGWEAEAGDGDEEDDQEETADVNGTTEDSMQPGHDRGEGTGEGNGEGIRTSHLRHFLAQPYIHPPLLIPTAPYNNRKFHIRTYVVAAGALRVYVYDRMLALFASESYVPPWETGAGTGSDTGGGDGEGAEQEELLRRRMRNIHLTNTCVQTAVHSDHTNHPSGSADSTDTDDTTNTPPSSQSPVHLLTNLPLPPSTHTAIHTQINATTAALFRAAVAQPTNFQPLPGAFEVFGVDFLVEDTSSKQKGMDGIRGSEQVREGKLSEGGVADGDQGGNDAGVSVQLLEVNAFPDFARTGEELRDLVVRRLFEEVVRVVVGPYFGVLPERQEGCEKREGNDGRLRKVLDIDLHLR